ncbi:MAG: class I adenylate-forming enzyme family protein, partial [bacterium]
MNIAEEIFKKADPFSVAVIEMGVTHSYGALNQWSEEIAGRLREEHRVTPSARIGLQCADGLNYIALALGVLRVGACFVPIAPELSKSEAETLASTLCLSGLLVGEKAAGLFSYSSTDLPLLPPWQDAFISMNPALIRFSSGTTGASKGILLSHETLRDRIIAANEGLCIGPDDRVLWVLSMAHHFAVSIMLYLWNGASIVFPDSHHAADILAAAAAHGATVFYGSPFHYVLLSAERWPHVWPTLRLAVSTTAQLPATVGSDFAAASGVYPSQALGLMEVGLPFLNQPKPSKRPQSIGRPQPAFEAMLLGEDGAAAKQGNPGELFLKGPGMFDAYIEPWKKRRDILQEGVWFATGDIARMDVEGFYYLQGRTKPVINVGGMKFFPEEVEELLCSHPGVADARVKSISHPTFGSIPVAEVVASEISKPTIVELNIFCRKQLARYKVPAQILFVDSIARTST